MQKRTTYEIKSWKEETLHDTPGFKMTRVTATKTYYGEIEGEALWESLMIAREDVAATFVASKESAGTCARVAS